MANNLIQSAADTAAALQFMGAVVLSFGVPIAIALVALRVMGATRKGGRF